MTTLEKWSKYNYMRVNEKKTKAVIFIPKNKLVPSHGSIINNFKENEIVDQSKCLGVIFSSNMSWAAHVNYNQHEQNITPHI